MKFFNPFTPCQILLIYFGNFMEMTKSVIKFAVQNKIIAATSRTAH